MPTKLHVLEADRAAEGACGRPGRYLETRRWKVSKGGAEHEK